MNNILVSVIIVNYNGLKYLDDCFISIKKNLQNISYEIIVVDNLSTDESVEFIKKKYPEVILIESTINLGFGQGNNLGVKHAKGKLVLLLNNDTILLNSLHETISFFMQNKAIGALGIKMLDANQNYLQSVGKFPNFINMLFFRKLFNNSKEFISGNFNNEVYFVDWITGAFMLINKETYTKINGFDPEYFMYVEDVDLCKKITNQNLKIAFYPSSEYIHFIGFNPKKNPLIIKGYQTYLKKHHTFLSRIILNCSLLINKAVKKFKYD
jgi:GT2 family glycosyltransferase